MAASNNFYDLYRHGSLGLTLTDALDELIRDESITPQLAMKVLTQFDRVVAETLQEKVKARLTFKGSLDTYRFCDEVWTFLIRNVTFKMEGNQGTVVADKVKIVSCSAKRNEDK
ncbi:transcription initiation factor IIA, gamma subunit-domain-containing protein [Apiosordaria backusii]|uniref:Transcription initiation factor IIA subunit 2 n=1 Tax=Apiosordaria backusii TaxID=314023 RepID=A0AA40ETB8_9PEZI|nr:transcription initiation factor IIA, gamma subunit-domain-containing protein [Apiosordaria backusii]